MVKWETRVFYGGAFDTDWNEVIRLTNTDAPGFDPNFEKDEGDPEWVNPRGNEYRENVEDMICEWITEKLSELGYELTDELLDEIENFASEAAEWYPWDAMEPALGYVEEEG